MTSRLYKKKRTVALVLVGLFGIAFGKIHLRVRSVVVGYEIGKLKSQESELLEKRSLLRMQVAQLTSRRHLELISDSRDIGQLAGRLAAQ